MSEIEAVPERTINDVKRDLHFKSESTMHERAERRMRVPSQGMIPHQYFSQVSIECRDLFVDGYFYGCISLVQALAEGIAKFLAGKNGVSITSDHMKLVRKLHEFSGGAILTADSVTAFGEIRGTPDPDRNTFHHLNDDIEQDRQVLEIRAEECMRALHVIESDVFGYSVGEQGTIVFKNAKYWDLRGDSALVHVRPK